MKESRISHLNSDLKRSGDSRLRKISMEVPFFLPLLIRGNSEGR